MIPIVTSSQMRNIDSKVINADTAIGFSYMLKAGMGLYDAVLDMELNREKDEIAIVCGKGNNGGDGYVVGRMLLDNGYRVMCYGLCEGESLTHEARLAYDEYIIKEGNFFYIDDVADLEGFRQFALIIDAVLGTGIQGKPRGLYAEVIKLINSAGKPVISVDTPSGLDNDTGKPGKPTIFADITVTMGFPKIGQLFFPGRSLTGKLRIKNLGYPLEIAEQNCSKMYLPTEDDLRHIIPPRKSSGSKFDHGLSFMLCGSRGMTGSAALSALSALRSGCGMVHCFVPESIIPVLSVKLTEPVLHPISETSEGTPSEKNISYLLEIMSSMQSALIGPGISHNHETSALVRKLLPKISIPVVLDADGLNAYKGYTKDIKRHKSELIITPHIREWERIFGPVQPNKPTVIVETLAAKSQEFSMTVVLKGNPTIIANKEGRAFILPVGNSGMATAGSGDVLGGIITSLLAQGCKPSDAAILGVAVHGLSGNEATKKFGEYSLIAGDIINFIPVVFNRIAPVQNPGVLPK